MNLALSVLIGNLAADPELTQGKKEPDEKGRRSDDRAYTRIAVNRPGRTGVDYFNLSAWGKLAHVLINFSEKGKNVTAVCTPRTWRRQRPDQSWENNVDFVATSIVLGESSQDVKNSKNKSVKKVEITPAMMELAQEKAKEIVKATLEKEKIEKSAEDPFVE